MKLHTNTLTPYTIYQAIPEGCRLALFTDKNGNYTDIEQAGSRSHDRSYTMRLSGSSPYAMQHISDNDKAATWDEWGIFIANLFKLDPDAKIGAYKTHADFIDQTTREHERITSYRPDLAKWHTAPWLAEIPATR